VLSVTTVKIIKANEEHRKDMARLIRVAKIGSLLEDESIKDMWVVKNKGRIVACAGLDFHGPKVAIFTSLVVEKKFRHQGIGSILIRHRTKIARERGASTIAFVTMYYHFNFYKRRGFITCPRKNLPDNVRSYWMFTTSRYKKCAVMLKHL
jgi:N-acetylglutamate synthase-like GNAT family acetyltransferase